MNQRDGRVNDESIVVGISSSQKDFNARIVVFHVILARFVFDEVSR